MNAGRYFLAGLPGSGKSTFLAAFWVYAKGAPNSSLEVESFPADADYLAELQQHWFGCTSVPRTSASVAREANVTVRRKADRQTFRLQIPDLSGESFGQIWSQRHWSDDFQAMADDARGALLFIHPGKVEDGATHQQVQALAGALGESDSPAEPPNIGAPAPQPTPWDIATTPTQVKLIEALQLLMEHTSIPQPFRLGLVISAWDTVLALDKKATPTGWLHGQMRCLMQFLQANPIDFETTVFGVSAQGADYGQITEAFQNQSPYDRCIVAGDSVIDPKDVTALVHWLVR